MSDASQLQVYQIKVRGLLPRNWSDCFNGTAISVESARDGTCTTVMTQVVVDQAALQGILNQLCDLNLTLISCTRLTQPETGNSSGKPSS
jgi:hypothetical protein